MEIEYLGTLDRSMWETMTKDPGIRAAVTKARMKKEGRPSPGVTSARLKFALQHIHQRLLRIEKKLDLPLLPKKATPHLPEMTREQFRAIAKPTGR